MKYCKGQILYIVKHDEIEKVKIESVRINGSKTTYWVNSYGSDYPLDTFDDKNFTYQRCDVKVVSKSSLISWSILLLLIILLVISF